MSHTIKDKTVSSTTSNDEMTITVTHSCGRFLLTIPTSATFSQLQEAFLVKAPGHPIVLWKLLHTDTDMVMQLAANTPDGALLSSFGIVDNSNIMALHLINGLDTEASRERFSRAINKHSTKQ